MTDDGFFRAASGVLLLSAIGVSGFYRSRAARQGGKLPDRPDGVVPPAIRLTLVLVIVALVVAPWVSPRFASMLTVDLPNWARWLGLGLTTAAWPAIWWTVATIGNNISETASPRQGAGLVVRGPYRLVQHPLYSIGFVALLGIGLMLGSLVLLAGVAGLLWWLPRRVAVEEQNLAIAFGDAHQAYRRRTGRFVPRLRQSGLPRPTSHSSAPLD